MKTATMEFTQRGRFEGMVNILRFNWPLYLRALAVATGAGLILTIFHFPLPIEVVGACAIFASVFYLGFSLLVSHWIYDRSPLYSLSWLDRSVPVKPYHIVNLTSGFDETTLRLKGKYPAATVETLDFYDPRIHTEPSIRRARAYRPPLPETVQVRPDNLNVRSDSVDLVLGILAIHEIRQPEERAVMFRSIETVLRPGGRCVVVEHLRDLPNFLAFGPGFFHFFSRSAWLLAAESPSLRLVDEFKITPFVRIFVLEKNNV